MSDIIRGLQSRHTGMRSLSTGKQIAMLSKETIEPTEMRSCGVSEEYIMYVKLGTLYTCNDAQRGAAEAYARIALARELYKDVHLAIDKMHMILCTYDNPYELRTVLDKLREDIGG